MSLLKSSVFALLCCLPFSLQAESPGLGFKFFDDTSTASCLNYGASLLHSFQFTDIRQESAYTSVRKGDVNIMIACGGTTNTLIVAGGKEASCVYGELLPLVNQRAVNNGTAMDCPFNETSTVAQIDDNLNIQIPQAVMPALGVDSSLWVNLNVIPNEQGLLLWELGNYGVNE
jgi:hypothetical protein